MQLKLWTEIQHVLNGFYICGTEMFLLKTMQKDSYKAQNLHTFDSLNIQCQWKLLIPLKRTAIKVSFQDVNLRLGIWHWGHTVTTYAMPFWSIIFHWHLPKVKNCKCRRSLDVEISHSWFWVSMGIPKGLIICHHLGFLLRHAFQSLWAGLPNS